MNFSRFLDLQSWWEVPSIAYFCSLFRTAFNLLDFDIEELEEALLTDGTEESASSLLTELIVRLLNGCLGNNDISAFNYQMYLRRLFRRKCQETGRYNPFNTDIDFQFLPLRTKVEILYALCDFRLDAEDVFDLFKNLEAESLRVEPLGWDDNDSAYWYFYGTRLYREDNIRKPKSKSKKKKSKDSRKRGWFYGDDWLDDDETERVWQVVCFTEEDWTHLTEKFSKASSKVEKELYRSLSQNFLPEIPRLFQEKERLQRKRLLELAPRRTSSRVLQKIKEKGDEKQRTRDKDEEEEERKVTPDLARENRAKRRNLLRSKSASSDSSRNSKSEVEEMPQKATKQSRGQDKRSKNSSATQKGEPPPDQPVKTGRKTNNSLASATGQILIPDNDEPTNTNSTRKKLKTSQIFSQTEEDIQTDMYKVLEQLTAHEDAWPFMDPVEEEYAPNYYAVIRRPMDLRKMEQRLDTGHYTDFSMFKADFKLIVNNCRLYNGQDNEYTTMVDNLQAAFDRLTEKYIHRLSSSDEEIAVEYQIPTPSRKHKLKSSESPTRHKKKKRKSHSDTGEPKSKDTSSVEEKEEEKPKEPVEIIHKKSKESHKSKDGKKKRKGHHRHGKHSKNHKKQHRSEHGESTKSRHSKKHAKNKDGKKSKSKEKKKKSKHHDAEPTIVLKKAPSQESLESSNRSRSASPLPSIHTPTPSPSEVDNNEQSDQLNDSDFFKDKYDKIKERRRHAAKEAWESLFDHKQKSTDKQNLHIPEKDKNQKLRETIEKLKAKNEKFKDSALFNSLFAAGQSGTDKTSDSTKESPNKDTEDKTEDISDDEVLETHVIKGKASNKKGYKKSSAKNDLASEALEQAVKDISKWLDDAPKNSAVSSPCDSPAQTISTEEQDSSRQDDELSQGEKSSFRKESRKRPSSREPKILKRREIQRTIDRLQPGKGKGNLLTNMSNKNPDKTEEVSPVGGPITGPTTKGEETCPKLSLGSVLPTVEFTLGNDHNFENDKPKSSEEEIKSKAPEPKEVVETEAKPEETKEEVVIVQPNKKDAEVETDLQPPTPMKLSQEKATPNLSAWFKAFGAPKSTPIVSSIKKKVNDTEHEEKASDNPVVETRSASPKSAVKFDSPNGPETPNPEGGDSPLPNVSNTPRQRRTSTGSSVSERSSFSQDLDSPRHQMSHTSPLLRSPASPRTDDFQKITYPIINGTVRAGFYHDTTSIKSSPEKSCSPRDTPNSPYSPYGQHVYASNSAQGSATPNYFVDHNKSPLPTYTQNPPPYYDTSKLAQVSKPARLHEDYTSLCPDSFQDQNQYTGPFSPAHTPYSQTQTTYSQPQHSPQPAVSNKTPTQPSTQVLPEPKNSLFPVKKRVYNEPEVHTAPKKVLDTKELPVAPQSKNDYHKSQHMSSSLPTQSVDDIALALSEKNELAKLNSLREKGPVNYMERHGTENKETVSYENSETAQDKKEVTIHAPSNRPIITSGSRKDNIDMVNMGYFNAEMDRRNSGDAHEINFSMNRDHQIHPNPKAGLPQQKGYEVDAIAINLGMNSQQMHKSTIPKGCNIPPAHSQERTHLLHERAHSDMNVNQNLAHVHHNQYDLMNSGQSIGNFSLNDIELANKKLHYSCNTTSSPAALDYGNWKMRPSDYPTNYSANSAEKTKTETFTVIDFNNPPPATYNASYHVARGDMSTSHSSELRIPNPRSHLKSEHSATSSSNAESESKTIESVSKSQKSEKLIQNHPLIGSIPYKTPYSSHSAIPLETLRNFQKIPQMLDRYANDERYLSSFPGASSALYHDKTYQMAQIFNKSMASEVHPPTSIYSQSSISASKDNNTYKSLSNTTAQAETKPKIKRKRTSESKAHMTSQNYHSTPCSSDVLSSVKSSIIPGSAFNFGASSNMGLGGGLYGENPGFSIEDFRNTTAANQLMAANYMAAAVAHQQRSNAESNAEKLAKPAHQNSAHTTSFPFMGHTQARAGYPFVGTDSSSPLYQQYLQRHQEEILRQTGAQIIGLYPPGYPASLGVRQPYDSINRPSWL